MKKIVQAIFGLRKGERGLSLLMFAYIFLLLVSLYLLKPVRDSLFLSQQGAAELPFVFILVSLGVIPTSVAYARMSRRMRMSRLINGVSLFLVANLLGFYVLVDEDLAWVYYLLYAWVSIYGVLITSQFWLLANAIFDAAQAKRVFAILSLGAILGSAAGGEITGLLTDTLNVDTSHLILVAAGVLAATVGLVNGIRYKYYREMEAAGTEADGLEPEPRRKPRGNIWTTLRRSRHLALIVGLIALTVLTTAFIDFQFKTAAANYYEVERNLTTFMGRFYGRVSLVAFVLQLIFGTKLIQRIGVGGSILALPVCLAAASVGMLLAPGLVAATILRGADQSLKHSIDKTGRELLFLPVSMKAKKRVKVFIDLFVDQGAQGVAGALLVLFTIVLDLTVRQVSTVVLVLLGLWTVVAVLARNSYIDRFRQMLRHRADDEDAPHEEAPTTIEDFQRLINQRSKPNVLSWMERLAEEEEDEQTVSAGELRQLMEHESPEVRRRTLQVLRLQVPDADELVDPVAAHLEDPDEEVRLAAARYLYQHLDGRERLPLIERGLRHPDFRIRGAALGLVARKGGREARKLVSPRLLRQMIDYEGDAAANVRQQVAHVLGHMEGAPFMRLLRELLTDDDEDVVRRAIQSAGRSNDRTFVPILMDHLENEHYKEEAREALVQYGDRIVGTVYDYLNDESLDPKLRQRLPGILAEDPSQVSVDVLLISLGRVIVPVRHHIAIALSKMRKEASQLRFNWETVRSAIEKEIRRYGMLGQVLHVRRQTTDEAAGQFPEDVLHEARKRSLECILRLLGLRYEQRDALHAFRGLTSEDRSLRAGAIEFLDNVLNWDLKRLIIPVLDDPTGEQAAKKGPELFDVNIQTWSQALLYLLRESDPSLKIQAINSAALEDAPEILRHVKPALDHADLRVREAAERALYAQP